MVKEALITIVDSNKNNPGSGIYDENYNPSKKYEEEAIRCFTSWRKNGGKFKDITIYALCISGRKLQESTIQKFKELKVTFLDYYLPETNEYQSGYFYVPIGCRWLEDNITEDFLIHIDLDMSLIKEPPSSFFYFDRNKHIAKVGIIPQPDRTASNNYAQYMGDYPINFNTCFITSWREDGFYKLWYNKIKETVPKKSECINDRIFSQWEEHTIDIMYFDDKISIEPLDKFQIGYMWEPLNNFTNEEFKKIYFFHDHIGTKGAIRTRIEYTKRANLWT